MLLISSGKDFLDFFGVLQEYGLGARREDKDLTYLVLLML